MSPFLPEMAAPDVYVAAPGVLDFGRRINTRKTFRQSLAVSLGSALAICLLYAAPAGATDIPAEANLNGYTPANGDTWVLQGDAYFSNGSAPSATKTLPTGTPGLAINGNGHTVTLNDGAGHYGRFIGTAALNVSLANVTITGGVNAGNSGAFYTPSGVLTLNTSGTVVFSDNRASAGGAIYTGGSLVFGGSASTIELTSNSASTTGGAIQTTGTTTITGASVTIANNTAETGGGAIRSTASVTINGTTTLRDNTTAASGGGIQTINSAIQIAATTGNVSITGNRAGMDANTDTTGDRGGALYAGASGVVTIGNSAGTVTITGNTAGFDASDVVANTNSNGGAISGGAMTLTGTSVVISNNKATSAGGALYAGGAVTIKGSLTADGNSAQESRGGFIYSSGAVSLAATTGNVTLTNNTAGNYGGAVYASGDITVGNSASTILATGNTAIGNGGAFMGAKLVTITGTTITISDNTATTYGGGIQAGAPGATLTAGTITLARNTARSGGGIQSTGAVTLTADTVTLSTNVANNGAGGGIASNGTVTVDGGLIADRNTATTNGGAIYTAANADIALTTGDVSLTGNTATGGSGGGVYATGAVALGNSAGVVEITGNTARAGGGIYTQSTTTLTGTTVTLSGNQATNTTGGAINATDTVTVNGNLIADRNTAVTNGGAIYTAANADIALTTGDVSLTGNTATGGSGGGVYATGAVALGNSAGVVELTDNSAGSKGGAIYAGAATTITGVTVTLANNQAMQDGGSIYAGGLLTIDGTLTSNQNTATGSGGAIYAASDITLGSNATAVAFTGNQAGAFGGAIWVDGNLTLNALNGDIAFSGNMQNMAGTAQANAIYLNNGAAASTLTLDVAAERVIAFRDPVENNAAQGLISVIKKGDGLVSFDGADHTAQEDRHSRLYAATQIDAGTFEVTNGAIYGVRAADVGNTVDSTFVMGANTILAGGVSGTVNADRFTLGSNATLNIAGRQPETRGVFTINSAGITLEAGSRILFNTELNDGVMQNTDLLVVRNATVSGTASILVTNINGAGAQTVGNGIRLVQLEDGATTQPTAFVLANRVAAGAYDYLLYQGSSSATDPNDTNWYLRSELNTPSAPIQPNIRPEVPVDIAIPALAVEYGYIMLDTLHERVAENWARPDQSTQKWAAGAWGRLIGNRGSVTAGDFSSRGPDYHYDFVGMQAGLDLFASERPDGTRDRAGFYLGYGQIDATIKSIYGGRAGTVDMDAYTLGGYWTHYAPSRWYTDAVVQGTWYNAVAKSVGNERISPNGFGIVTSLEGGYAFDLGRGATLEPQAQLIYQNLSFDDAQDAFAQISFANTNNLRGRVGARLAQTWNTADATAASARPITGWLRANLWHEFLGDTKTTFAAPNGANPTQFSAQLDGTWGEIGAGVSGQLTQTVSLFMTASYSRAVDDNGREAWGGRGGLAFRW